MDSLVDLWASGASLRRSSQVMALASGPQLNESGRFKGDSAQDQARIGGSERGAGNKRAAGSAAVRRCFRPLPDLPSRLPSPAAAALSEFSTQKEVLRCSSPWLMAT